MGTDFAASARPIPSSIRRIMSDTAGPGQTALIRTPDAAASRAAERTSPSTACLLAE